MKFSVIIPIYNVEAFVEETVGSVLRQTYEEFEILLVDDGSTDKSGTICDALAAKHPEQVRVIHTKNQGAGPARVTGIQNADGDVLLFVDSDDSLRQDTLEQLKQRFDADQCDLIIFNASRSPDFSTSFFDFSTINGQVFTADEKNKLYEQLVTTRSLNPMWQKAVKKQVALDAVNDISELWIKNGQDFLMSIPVLTLSEKVEILDENLYYYRDRAGSAVHTVRLSRVEATKTIHNKLAHYIDIWGLPELHEKHCARMVSSWIALVSMVMMAGKEFKPSQRKKILRSLAEDTFFRSAYDQMEECLLPKKEAVLARWLYDRRYIRLELVYAVKKLAH